MIPIRIVGSFGDGSGAAYTFAADAFDYTTAADLMGEELHHGLQIA